MKDIPYTPLPEDSWLKQLSTSMCVTTIFASCVALIAMHLGVKVDGSAKHALWALIATTTVLTMWADWVTGELFMSLRQVLKMSEKEEFRKRGVGLDALATLVGLVTVIWIEILAP